MVGQGRRREENGPKTSGASNWLDVLPRLRAPRDKEGKDGYGVYALQYET